MIHIHSSFEEVSTPGQTPTGLGPRVYPFTTPGSCTAWIISKDTYIYNTKFIQSLLKKHNSLFHPTESSDGY